MSYSIANSIESGSMGEAYVPKLNDLRYVVVPGVCKGKIRCRNPFCSHRFSPCDIFL